MKSKIHFLIMCALFIGLLSCSKKEEEKSSSEDKAKSSPSIASEDLYEEFLNKIDNSIAKLLPQKTSAFLLFLNTDGVAEKQRKYFENNLPEDFSDMFQETVSDFTKILDDIGLLKGRSVQEVLGYESAHFLIKNSLPEKESENTGENFESGETEKGFILTLNEQDLHKKAEEIVKALNENGSTVKLVKKDTPAYIEVEDAGENVQLKNFNFIGIKDSIVVAASSKSVLNEIFETEKNALPEIFRSSKFSKLAKGLPDISKSVIFAGINGKINEFYDYDKGVKVDDIKNPEIAERIKKSKDLKNANLLIAFNQTYLDKENNYQLRVDLSEEAQKFFKVENEEFVNKAENSYTDSTFENSLLTMELSQLSTRLLLDNSKEQLIKIDPKFAEVVANINNLYFSLNSIDKQKSFLPIPAISLKLKIQDKKEEVLKIIEDLLKSVLEKQGVVPPGSEWVESSDNSKSILTAFGEEVVLASNESEICIGTSRDDINKLLGLESDNNGDLKKIELSGYVPQYHIGESKELSMLFINLKAVYKSLEKVFAMGQAFGQKQSPSEGFDFESFGKAVSTIGAIGTRTYLEDDSTLVVSSRLKGL